MNLIWNVFFSYFETNYNNAGNRLLILDKITILNPLFINQLNMRRHSTCDYLLVYNMIIIKFKSRKILQRNINESFQVAWHH